jgi:hypothetical protein
VTEVENVTVLLRGAWKEVVTRVLRLKPRKGDRAVFVASKDEVETALGLFREKAIAPAAWFAWYGLRSLGGTQTPTLGRLMGLPWLGQGSKRGWFRKDTAGLFGGRSVVVGRPPLPGVSVTQAQAYIDRATTEKARLEAAWVKRAEFGAIFANADLTTLGWGRP